MPRSGSCKKLLGDVLAQLEKQVLTDQLPPPEMTTVANPFE
ncbi:hypothetical protein [Janthinobacterium sp. 61]|nr:hypothetical protein [Janthinobacterium sp. 61]